MKLETIFRAKEHQLMDMLANKLKQSGYQNVNKAGAYLYAKGELPIMLVAHLDTVHATMPTNIFWDKKYNVYWSPQGLGADDRAGVWAILQLLKYKPYVLFTTGEESGGIGARAACKKLKKPNVQYIIQLDREGDNEAVFYDCDNQEFTDYILSYGFRDEWGTFSDISVLCPEWKIAGVNLSVGYYGQHTKMEHLSMKALGHTIQKVSQMLENPPDKQFKYVESAWYKGLYGRCKYGSYNYDDDKDWKGKGGKYNIKYGDKFLCESCGILMDIKFESEEPYICVDCYYDFHRCEYCAEYKPKHEMSSMLNMCKDCYKILMAEETASFCDMCGKDIETSKGVTEGKLIFCSAECRKEYLDSTSGEKPIVNDSGGSDETKGN